MKVLILLNLQQHCWDVLYIWLNITGYIVHLFVSYYVIQADFLLDIHIISKIISKLASSQKPVGEIKR